MVSYFKIQALLNVIAVIEWKAPAIHPWDDLPPA